MSTPLEGCVVPPGFRLVEITREPIELYTILKFEGMVASGGPGALVSDWFRAVIGS